MNVQAEITARLNEVRNAKDRTTLTFMHGNATGFFNAMFRLNAFPLEQWTVANERLSDVFNNRSRELSA